MNEPESYHTRPDGRASGRPVAHTKGQTGYPFNTSRSAYLAELRGIPTADLIAEIEAWQYLALDVADTNDGSRAYVEHQLAGMVEELERRQRLLTDHRDDPLRPRWPRSDERFRARIAAVKAAWPVERFCRELLLLDLIPAGAGTWKSRCPLPGHDDKTPSFVLYETTQSAYCFGCKRGGDVLKLSQYVLNLDRFTDALTMLEREGGVR